MNLNAKQLHTLRHMLGINTPDDKIPKPYRNYAAVVPGDSEYVRLESLRAIRKYHSFGDNTPYDWYECTKEGRLAAIQSHRTIRKTKAQREYITYLNMTDIYQDLTFKDFLTSPDFSSVRRMA